MQHAGLLQQDLPLCQTKHVFEGSNRWGGTTVDPSRCTCVFINMSSGARQPRLASAVGNIPGEA